MKPAAVATPARSWCVSILRYFRPAEVETLLGDPTNAREKLGWRPTTTGRTRQRDDHHRPEETCKEAYLKRKGFEVVGTRE